MPREILYGEVRDLTVDVAALRHQYETVVSQTPPVPYRDGELNYQGWSITSRDGTTTDGVVRNKSKSQTIREAVIPTPVCTGVLRDLLGRVQALDLGFYRARIFRLADSGYDMKFHTDTDFEGWRLHVPIITNERSFFEWQLADGEIVSVHLPADGRAWFVRVDQRHRAINTGRSAGDRVHLILCISPRPQRRHFGENRFVLPPELLAPKAARPAAPEAAAG